MYKIVFVDEDKEYLQLAKEYARNKKMDLICFDDYKLLDDYSELKVDLIVVNEKISKKIKKSNNKILVLNENNRDIQKENEVYKYQNFENIIRVMIKMIKKNNDSDLFGEEILIYNISHDYNVKKYLDKYIVNHHNCKKIFKWEFELFTNDEIMDGMDLSMALNAQQYLNDENYLNKLKCNDGVYSFYPIKTPDVYFKMKSSDYKKLKNKLYDIGMQNIIMVIDDLFPCMMEYMLKDIKKIFLIYKEMDKKKEERIKKWINTRMNNNVKIMERRIYGNKKDDVLIASLMKEI